MLLTSHVVMGAAIGSSINNFIFAITFSFISHFILDLIPHAQAPTDEDYRPNKKTFIWVIIDLLFVFLFIFSLRLSKLLNLELLIVTTVSVVPDILDVTRYNKYFYDKFRIFYNFHDKLQNETNRAIGYITQLFLILISLIIIGITNGSIG